jgi:hypothetical protein
MCHGDVNDAVTEATASGDGWNGEVTVHEYGTLSSTDWLEWEAVEGLTR